MMKRELNNKPFILNHTNWGTVQKEKYEIAVLPWGASEPHNLHLPYGTDTLQSTDIAIGAAVVAWEKATVEKGKKCFEYLIQVIGSALMELASTPMEGFYE
ncbi:MAG: creatininase family protein [Marinilabiliaceae bacterium]|nr:creatininase family protein [Marinilabiliaceae bacterium]